ncbi:Ger(x)C family spore germination protein [Paenibacillus sp. CGMCC 1.16610]|uniref:Ger(X)C family spore germination protein n=1 Tax=Paenibacillus anseongense TaxID=2682845 RepID=A0ABW9UBZ5_9BACL|nr:MULTISPECIES: Ger(x)C family spore germination protein [Paenibacillus]MBA2937715.1 Ger(x)C family spore germination protein [Paenibacillus sp. CGMCC 1.16610]MVQ36773.1 Ger(x)C family spore germination protein [Paenibacillus anseongense]
MKPFLYMALLVTLLTTSGCWDRTEINDLAFIMGTAFDVTEDGNYILSHQIAIPSSAQGGPGSGVSSKEKFFVISAVGSNINEAFYRLQKKSSRRLFTAHRVVIYIGEKLSKRGIKDILDIYTHDSKQRLRTYIMVVKGGEGRELLKVKYPFEQVPSEAIKEMEGLRSELAISLRDFFLASSGEGISPVLGVIMADGITEGVKEGNIFKLAGSAIFKDFKLAGFLNENETNGFLWVTDRMKNGSLNANVPDSSGTVGMILAKTDRKITPEISGDKIKFNIQLHGEGNIWENNTNLDIRKPENLRIVETALEKAVEGQIHDTLSKVQKQYKVDSVGFGREIYRDKPKQWRTLKNQWDNKFPEVTVSLEVKLTILGSGMAGPPLHLERKEIIK